MIGKEEDFYHKIRVKMREWLASSEGSASEWAEYLMLAPDLFHLMWKLSADPGVPASEKAKLAIAIAYFISPVDLIPEVIFGPLGFTDDIVLTAYVLNGIVNKTDPELVRKYWAGDEDVLIVIKNILSVADRMVGSGIFSNLKKYLG
ncbi:YkvA family protein [candidate division KSB1 bacterium]